VSEFDNATLIAIKEHIESQNGLLGEVRTDVKELRVDFSYLRTDIEVLKKIPKECIQWDRIRALEERQTLWRGGLAALGTAFGLVGAGVAILANWLWGNN